MMAPGSLPRLHPQTLPDERQAGYVSFASLFADGERFTWNSIVANSNGRL
jgi:hypothetical protein